MRCTISNTADGTATECVLVRDLLLLYEWATEGAIAGIALATQATADGGRCRSASKLSGVCRGDDVMDVRGVGCTRSKVA